MKKLNRDTVTLDELKWNDYMMKSHLNILLSFQMWNVLKREMREVEYGIRKEEY